MRSHATKLVAGLCVLAGLFVPAAAAAAPAIDGTFPLGGEVETNDKIVAGPDGNVWLTVQSATKDVARVTPAGQVDEFDIEGIETASGIVVGPDGNLWITDVEKAAKFNPGDPEGSDKSFTVAGIGAGGQIAAGPDGLIWVASNNQLVRFNPVDPTNVQPVTVNGEMSPKDIDVSGSLIVIADGGAGNRIITFTSGGTQQDFAIAGGSQGVAGASSGQIAFTAPGASPEESGLISPPNPAQSFELLGDPFGVTLGNDGAYWIVQFAFGQLARVTTSGQVTFLTGLPVESARQIAVGPNNTLWVTLQKNEAKGVVASVARVTGVEPEKTNPPPPPPTTTTVRAPESKIDKGRKKVVKTKKARAKVKFRFSSSTAAVTFQCSLTKLKGKKTKAAAFKGCKSPQAYKLRPGRYRFQVRAVDGSTPDPTPAVRKFEIVHID
jgi:streptogramin lyase